MSNCCIQCFSDELIKGFIESSGNNGDCDYCTGVGFPIRAVEEVGRFIREGVHRYYEDAAAQVPYVTAEGGYLMRTTTITEILSFELDIFSKTLDNPENLVEELIDDDGTGYVRRDPAGPPAGEPDEIRYWNDFCEIIVSSQRYTAFLSTDGLGCFEEHPSFFLNRIAEYLNNALLINEIPTGTKIYRARIFRDQIKFTHNDLTSAPVIAARNNRMSPAGISFFYGCYDANTSIAEVRPSVGDRIAVAEFELIRPLTVLDLSHQVEQSLSIFDENYNFEYEEYFKPFLRHFSSEIARPIRANEAEIMYIPTQAFTEFIRMHQFSDHVQGIPLVGGGTTVITEPETFMIKGIVYRSSVDNTGRNITLFRGPDISTTNQVEDESSWLHYNGYREYEVDSIYFSSSRVGQRTWRRRRRN